MDLAGFIHSLNRTLGRLPDPRKDAAATARLLPGILSDPTTIPKQYTEPGPTNYRQHVAYVHPHGRYSIVSLVWLPGQSTPIHDHRCWCVVGVLRGTEKETQFLPARAPDGRLRLEPQAPVLNRAGSVSVLVPPDNNIHMVANSSSCADEPPAISLHIYGADIQKLGSSIHQVFDSTSVGVRFA